MTRDHNTYYTADYMLDAARPSIVGRQADRDGRQTERKAKRRAYGHPEDETLACVVQGKMPSSP